MQEAFPDFYPEINTASLEFLQCICYPLIIFPFYDKDVKILPLPCQPANMNDKHCTCIISEILRRVTGTKLKLRKQFWLNKWIEMYLLEVEVDEINNSSWEKETQEKEKAMLL